MTGETTYNLTVTNGGNVVFAFTGLTVLPVLNIGPPPRVTYTHNGDEHVYFVKPGDDVSIKTVTS